MTEGEWVSTDDIAIVQRAIHEGIIDAWRYGIGAAIRTIQQYRGQSVDVETLDKVIDDLRRQSAEAENER